MGEKNETTIRLCSIFDTRLIPNTYTIHRWAGRKSRGVAQFTGKGLMQILDGYKEPQIDEQQAREFLEKLMKL